MNKYETLVIRPPSEAQSLLLRINRGCPWNRCKFCGIYTALGQSHYSIRTVTEIKKDIFFLKKAFPDSQTIFLGDADPLCLSTDDFICILDELKNSFPKLNRITCYARASTIWKKGISDIQKCAKHGLNRIHIGLETGSDFLLRFHKKGLTRKVLIQTSNWLKQNNIERSYYVLLGLGGKQYWQDHIDKTASILTRINPEFIRIRRLWLYKKGHYGSLIDNPLFADINTGNFVPQSPEETINELKMLLEKLDVYQTFFTCDHANNFFRIEGMLPEDKKSMLEKITHFLALPEDKKQLWYDSVISQI
ncbi:radical SAM protein [Chlamydiota bacterium]